jgi:hypothetical protein
MEGMTWWHRSSGIAHAKMGFLLSNTCPSCKAQVSVGTDLPVCLHALCVCATLLSSGSNPSFATRALSSCFGSFSPGTLVCCPTCDAMSLDPAWVGCCKWQMHLVDGTETRQQRKRKRKGSGRGMQCAGSPCETITPPKIPECIQQLCGEWNLRRFDI